MPFSESKLRILYQRYIKEVESERVLLERDKYETDLKSENVSRKKKRKAVSLERDNVVNLNDLINIVIFLNENAYAIGRLLECKFTINSFRFEENGDVDCLFADADDFLEPITKLTLMPRDAILLLLHSYDDSRINEEEYCPVPRQILIPPKFEFGKVIWEPGIERAIGEFRYINNFDVGDAISKCEEVVRIAKAGNFVSSNVREARLYLNYVKVVLNQTRSINISKCVLAMLLVSITKKGDVINPGVKYIQILFDKYVRWPYLDTNLGMRWITPNGVSSQIPLLLYSILNRMVSWDTGVINDVEFHLCMYTYFEWSITSFDDEHLLQKSKMNKVRKLLNERVIPQNVLQFNNLGVSGIAKTDHTTEFWLEGEKEELISIINDTKSTRKYFDHIKQLLNKTFTRDEIIRIKMALACVSNPSTYKKSSPILEYDRSAEGRPKAAIFTKVTETIDSFPLKFKYTGVLEKLWNKLMSKMGPIREGMKNRNFYDEYYNRLTNNSAGMTQNRINAERSSNPLLRAFSDIPYGSRYVSALVDNETLVNKVELMSALSTPVKAGKREQIDRRSRWIMMVMNPLQVIFSVALSFSREFQKTNNYIASGKQVGDCRDMLQSLRSSANQYSLITDNDIVGMDSSTQEQISNFVLYGLFYSLEGIPIREFFYASEGWRTVKVTHENGIITTYKKHLNAVQMYLIDVVSYMRANPFEFTEGVIVDTVKLPAAAFWSGAFHTAGQHNTILGLILEIVNEEYVALKSIHEMRINGAILGDDLSIEVKCNKMNDEVEELMRGFITRLRADLLDIGFEADPESSRYEATFLQQSTFMGAIVPKHARISVFCAENGVGRSRNPFDQISELGDILDELSARTFCPERCNVILSALWMSNHCIKLSKFFTSEQSIRKRLHSLSSTSSLYKQWVRSASDGVTIIIPYYGILIPEVNGVQFPVFQDVNEDFYEPSYFTPRGTITEWFMVKISYYYYNKNLNTFQYYVNKGISKYKSSLKNKFSKGLISEPVLKRRLNRSYGLSINDLINHDLLFEMGFGFSQWLFNLFKQLVDLPPEKKRDPSLQMLINIGKQKLNPMKSAQSYIAGEKLLNNNISVSAGLAYYNQPRTRIIQAIEASKRDTKMNLNEKIVDKIVSLVFNNKPVYYKFKDISILSIDVEITDVPISPTPIAPYLRESTLCPCVRADTDEWKLQQIFGVPFDNPGVDKLTDFFKINLPFGSDPERIFDEALKVNSKDPRMLSLYLSYVGLPDTLHTQAARMINEYGRVGVIGYQSIKSTRKFFYIGTSIYDWPRFMIERSFATERKKWAVLSRSFARDYLLAFPYTNNKVNVKISTELALRLVTEN